MKSQHPNAAGDPFTEAGSDTESETTGLPRLRTWRSVYIAVGCIFVLWVGLLTWLTETFS